jgi:hypothetical protein
MRPRGLYNSTFFRFLITLTPHMFSASVSWLRFFLSCVATSLPRTSVSKEKRNRTPVNWLQGNVLALCWGPGLCSRLAWFRTLSLHALPS